MSDIAPISQSAGGDPDPTSATKAHTQGEFQQQVSHAVSQLQGQAFASGAQLAAALKPHLGNSQIGGLASHPYGVHENALELIAMGRDPRIFPDDDRLGLVHFENTLVSQARSRILGGLTAAEQQRFPEAAAEAEQQGYVRIASGDLVRPSPFYARRHPEVAKAMGYTGPVFERPSPALGRFPTGGHGRLIAQASAAQTQAPAGDPARAQDTHPVTETPPTVSLATLSLATERSDVPVPADAQSMSLELLQEWILKLQLQVQALLDRPSGEAAGSNEQ
jgi:hypothetical protein